MSTTVQDKALEQRYAALAQANDVRIARATFKRVLKQAPDRSTSAYLLAHALVHEREDPAIGTAKVYELVLGVKGVGMGQTRKLMRCVGFGGTSDRRRVNELSDTQLTALALRLGSL